MIGWGRVGIVLLAGAWAGLAASGAAAQTASGMLMEVSGQTEPAVQALSEVQPGFTVKLAPGAKLSFVHYSTCKLVNVEGGTVTLKLTAYTVTDGKVLNEQKRCPKRFALVAGGSTEAGALVVRGDAPRARPMAARPIVLLAGTAADSYSAAELRSGDRLVASMAVSGRRAALPDSAPALKPGEVYQLVLVPKSGGKPATTAVTVVEAGPDPLDRSIVLSVE